MIELTLNESFDRIARGVAAAAAQGHEPWIRFGDPDFFADELAKNHELWARLPDFGLVGRTVDGVLEVHLGSFLAAALRLLAAVKVEAGAVDTPRAH